MLPYLRTAVAAVFLACALPAWANAPLEGTTQLVVVKIFIKGARKVIAFEPCKFIKIPRTFNLLLRITFIPQPRK